jgi:endonuclease/exonuclease/phosphatase family metal-dependent hydrolase
VTLVGRKINRDSFLQEIESNLFRRNKKMAVLFSLILPVLILIHIPGSQQTAQGPVPSSTIDSEQTKLLESGAATKLRTSGRSTTNQIKIISYNIRWRSGEDLKKMIQCFLDDPEIGNAAILGLQEVDRKKKRSGNTNTAKLIAEELGMHYVWAAPPSTKSDSEEETGVAILSIYPISDIKRIVLPHEGPNKRRRVALGATVNVEGRPWRVYSAHGETRLSFDKKLEQMGTLLKDLSRYPANMPAVIVGDFNTWEGGAGRKTIKLFSDAGLKTPFGTDSTFSRRILFVPIEFRLDWVWLRGVEPVEFGIDKKIGISDHWPLWTKVSLPAASRN